MAVQPGALPLELNTFVGRVAELSDLRRKLAVVRLLTVTGAGGSGKTRVALHAAASMQRSFPDGIFAVSFDEVEDDHASIGRTIADSLGLLDVTVAPMDDVIVEHIGDRRVLLVFDGCEQAVEGVADFAQLLLQRCPRVKLLATSRRQLRVPGEAVLALPPLALADAVQLLIDRSAATGGALVSPADQSLVRLCDSLDRQPLAIELAAARLGALSADQITATVAESLALLRGSRAAPARQRTLEATIEWSHRLITEPERTLWRRLSVFGGGFTVESARSVCSDESLKESEVPVALAELVEASIVIPDVERPGRARMLETIRRFGRDRLAASGEAERLRGRHVEWIRQIAEQWMGEWWGPRQALWLDRFEAERLNVRAALETCTDMANAEAGLTIFASLLGFWHTRGHIGEALHHFDSLAALPGASDRARALAYAVAAYLLTMRGDAARANQVGLNAQRFADAAADDRAKGYADVALGYARLFSRDARGAVRLAERARSLHRRTGDQLGEAMSLYSAAIAKAALGDDKASRSLCEEGTRLCDAGGDDWVRALFKLQLGTLDLSAHRDAEAENHLRGSLRAGRAVGDRWHAAQAIEELGWLAAQRDDNQRAARLLGGAQAILDSIPAVVPEEWRAQHEAAHDMARKALGGSYQASFDSGRASGLSDMIAFALGERDKPEAAVVTASLLSPRELEVARYVAEGLPNRAIGERLFLSPRTVETHLAHVMNKLGVNTRAAVAAWVAAESASSKIQ